jgi:signal transduction histidine kinase
MDELGSPPVSDRVEQVLLLEHAAHEVKHALEEIVEQLPHITLTEVSNLESYRKQVLSVDYDIVILDYDLSGDQGMSLIHELQLKDYEPAVLIVSSKIHSRVFNEVFNQGLYRYIIKDGMWREEIGPALRSLLRIRRLEQENRNLLAKLTEANALLNEKNRRLDEFSATLAHDIRGPLGGICMKLEYILDSYGTTFDPKLFGLLDRARMTSERLTHIVQAMYDFAKLGSKAAKMDTVNLVELVSHVCQDLSYDDALDISIIIDKQLPVVWGSRELLARVFLNLIQNAIKYNDKAEMKVEVGLDTIESKTLGSFARIFVRDNGQGIPEPQQREIFTTFSRGLHTSHKKEGLGLGLSVVQRIVELHFGKVWVESVVGQGSTFFMLLPIDEISFAR